MTGFEPGSSSIGSELCHNAVIYLYFIETYLNRIITLYALGRFVYNRISTFLMFTRSKKIYHDRHSKLQDLKMTFFSVSKKPKGQFFIVLSCFVAVTVSKSKVKAPENLVLNIFILQFGISAT